MTVWPNGLKTRPDISGSFGKYPDGTPHYGTDFINFDYNHAIMGGVVEISDAPGSAAGNDAGGVEVRILHDNGDRARYLHNKVPYVSVGDRVVEGQRIGLQGSSGTMTTGKHLHFEVWKGGSSSNRIDPVPYLQNLVTSSAGGGGGGNIINIRKGKDEMPIFIEPTTIVWPNGYTNSYERDVYAACWTVFVLNDTTDWRVQTFVRESWAAANFMTERNAKAAADATVAALKASGVPVKVDVDTAKIATDVVAKLGKPVTKAELDASLANVKLQPTKATVTLS